MVIHTQLWLGVTVTAGLGVAVCVRVALFLGIPWVRVSVPLPGP